MNKITSIKVRVKVCSQIEISLAEVVNIYFTPKMFIYLAEIV